MLNILRLDGITFSVTYLPITRIQTILDRCLFVKKTNPWGRVYRNKIQRIYILKRYFKGIYSSVNIEFKKVG